MVAKKTTKKTTKKTAKKQSRPSIFANQCEGIRRHIDEVQDEIDSIDQILNERDVPERVKGPLRKRRRNLISLLRNLRESLRRCLAAL